MGGWGVRKADDQVRTRLKTEKMSSWPVAVLRYAPCDNILPQFVSEPGQN